MLKKRKAKEERGLPSDVRIHKRRLSDSRGENSKKKKKKKKKPFKSFDNLFLL
jgi:hypothetical protein